MKSTILIAILALFAVPAMAQYSHEYAPIEEKEISYLDWTYPTPDDSTTNLREFSKGKKLVLVFYFAPWCHSSNFQAPITQKLFEKYEDKGLGVIGISMYDSVNALKSMLKNKELTFPVVVESEKLSARKFSQHYKYRWSTGDYRKWGTPWNIFLFPDQLKKDGDVLTEKAFIANGELREYEAEAFIRKALGLPPLEESDIVETKSITSH